MKKSVWFDFQMDKNDGFDQQMEEFLLDLGRKHFSYGARPQLMELLGRVFVESLNPLFEDHHDFSLIQESWNAFFGVIVFWMKMGFKYVQNKGRIQIQNRAVPMFLQ